MTREELAAAIARIADALDHRFVIVRDIVNARGETIATYRRTVFLQSNDYEKNLD